MTEEDIQNFMNEQKEFSAKKKRIDRGKRVLSNIGFIESALKEKSDSGKLAYLRKIFETGGGIEKDSTLERNFQLFLTVLKEDYEKEFKNL